MTNPERDPDELALAAGDTACGVEVLTPREVPLGGPRAMTVRRTLPQRHRSLIGAWCFVDHYGPDDVADTGGMVVAPAPAHRAADGELALHRRDRAPRLRRPPRHGPPRRGQPDDRRPRHQPLGGLHGRDHGCTAPSCGWRCPTPPGTRARASSTTRPTPVAGDGLGGPGVPGLAARGHVAGVDPHPAARRRADARRPAPRSTLDVDASFEHGVLLDAGAVDVDGEEAEARDLAYVRARRATLTVDAHEDGAAAAARRPAVRRVHRHVVELRGPHPRGGRRLPRGVAGPGRHGVAPPGRPSRTVASVWSTTPAADPGAGPAQRQAQAASLTCWPCGRPGSSYAGSGWPARSASSCAQTATP